jgi:uncharacterized alkaline shock family protein YloU
MSEATNLLGTIFISHRAIATIAYQAALLSYGVVGLAPKTWAEGLAQVLVKDPMMGVEIFYNGKDLGVNLYIIIEYGTRIKSVASSVVDNVRYMLEKSIGVPVCEVNVHVRGLRVSNTD